MIFSGFVDTCGTGKRNRAGALVLGNGRIDLEKIGFIFNWKILFGENRHQCMGHLYDMLKIYIYKKKKKRKKKNQLIVYKKITKAAAYLPQCPHVNMFPQNNAV